MTINYTTLLGLAEPVTGTESGTWGDDVNKGLTDYLDAAIAGAQTISGSQTAVTLSITNGSSSGNNLAQAGTGTTGSSQYQIINCTGNPASLLTITVPASSKTYVVINQTSTSQSVKVVGSGPTTGVTVISGEKALIAWSGSDFVKVGELSGDATFRNLTAATITNTGLTSGRVVYSTTGGLETDSANLTFNGTTLTANTLNLTNALGTAYGGTGLTSFTANGVVYASSTSALTTGSALTFDGAQLGVNGITVGRGAGAVATNTAVGASALAANSSGSGTSAFGDRALAANTSGTNNAAFGQLSLYGNTAGGTNSAFGHGTLFTNTTGSSNTAVGDTALFGNTTASNNTAVGYQAGYSNTTGTQNVYMGVYAGQVGTTSSYNIALGFGALNQNTGSNNAASGYYALASNSSGAYNTAHGSQALYSNTTASNNTAVGYQALTSNTTSNYNTAVGYQAGYSVTGGYNTHLGYLAGSNLTSGAAGVYLGSSSQASAGSASYEIVIGYGITGKGTNTGFISPNGGGVYQGNNSTLWSITSDQRLKKNIVDNTVGLSAVNQIKVRNFEYRLPDEITELDKSHAINISGVQIGPIAQELQQVLPDCVKTESTGVMSVNSSNLIWHMVNAIQELSAQVAQLQSQLKGN